MRPVWTLLTLIALASPARASVDCVVALEKAGFDLSLLSVDIEQISDRLRLYVPIEATPDERHVPKTSPRRRIQRHFESWVNRIETLKRIVVGNASRLTPVLEEKGITDLPSKVVTLTLRRWEASWYKRKVYERERPPLVRTPPDLAAINAEKSRLRILLRERRALVLETLAEDTGASLASFYEYELPSQTGREADRKRSFDVPFEYQDGYYESKIWEKSPAVHLFCLFVNKNWNGNCGAAIREYLEFIHSSREPLARKPLAASFAAYAKGKDPLWSIWNQSDLERFIENAEHGRPQ